MEEKVRLNSIIRVLERKCQTFVAFSAPEVSVAEALGTSAYDGVVFDMEHNPYDVNRLKQCLQFLLDRRRIVEGGTLASAMTPMVRVPANGGEMNQWLAKQVLDLGAFGVIWPHISTIDEARSAVAACRYPRPASATFFEPAGRRGDGPRAAVKYQGLSQKEYYACADVWPLNPNGEILVGIMCEDLLGMKNLPAILEQVPGIGVVLIGQGDISQEMGVARQYEHPVVVAAVDEILAICKEYGVVCGHPHVRDHNVEQVLAQGFHWLTSTPVYSFPGLERGLRLSGRS